MIDLIGFYGEGSSAVSLECSIRCPARRRVEVAVETSTRQGHPIPRTFLVSGGVAGVGGCGRRVLVAGSTGRRQGIAFGRQEDDAEEMGDGRERKDEEKETTEEDRIRLADAFLQLEATPTTKGFLNVVPCGGDAC